MAGERDIAVPAPAGVAWRFLTDLGAVASCLPGVTLDTVEPDQVTGRCRARLGGSTITYRGSLRVAAADPVARTAVLEATGAEARGEGKVRITVEVQVEEADAAEGAARDAARVRLRVTGDATGRALAFGPEVLGVSAGRLLDRFVGSLRDRLAALPADEAAQAPEPAEAPEVTASAGPGQPAEAAEVTVPAEPGGVAGPLEQPQPGETAAERRQAAGGSVAEETAEAAKPAGTAGSTGTMEASRADETVGADEASTAGRTDSTTSGATPAGEARAPRSAAEPDALDQTTPASAPTRAEEAQDAAVASAVPGSGTAPGRGTSEPAGRQLAPVEPLDLFGPPEPSRLKRFLKLATLTTLVGIVWRRLRLLFRRRA